MCRNNEDNNLVFHQISFRFPTVTKELEFLCNLFKMWHFSSRGSVVQCLSYLRTLSHSSANSSSGGIYNPFKMSVVTVKDNDSFVRQ